MVGPCREWFVRSCKMLSIVYGSLFIVVFYILWIGSIGMIALGFERVVWNCSEWKLRFLKLDSGWFYYIKVLLVECCSKC